MASFAASSTRSSSRATASSSTCRRTPPPASGSRARSASSSPRSTAASPTSAPAPAARSTPCCDGRSRARPSGRRARASPTATLGAKATFYELLLENADALELFCALAAASDFLVETLARRPGVFDDVVDRLLTGSRPTRDEVREELRAALARADTQGPERW